MVARDAEGVAGVDHAHHQAQDAGAVGAAVDEVADEARPTALGVLRVDRPALRVAGEAVAQVGQQLLELGPAAVDVADDVERAVVVAPVVVLLLVHDRGGLDLVDAVEDVDLAEPLPGQPAQAASQVCALPPDHCRVHGAIAAGGVALDGDALGDVEDDGHRQDVVVAGELDERGAVLALDVGRVDDGQPTRAQPGGGDVVQQSEGGRRRGLVVLVVGHHPAAGVARQHLRRAEVLSSEAALAAAGDADEQDEGQVGDGQDGSARCGAAGVGAHAAASLSSVGPCSTSPTGVVPVRVKTPICVGGPTSRSSVPTASSRTS